MTESTLRGIRSLIMLAAGDSVLQLWHQHAVLDVILVVGAGFDTDDGPVAGET